MKPSRHQFTVLKQIIELIPGHLVPKLAREHGVDKKSRKFTPWSHVVSLVFTQLRHGAQVCRTAAPIQANYQCRGLDDYSVGRELHGLG